MEIEFFGANCFRVKTKQATIVIDDNLDALGSKTITAEKNVLVYSNKMLESDSAKAKARLVLDSPGEFEVGDLSLVAIQARSHMDEEGVESATVFQCMYSGVTVTFLGHIHPDVSSELLELAGGTDVLVVPVGGNGFTLDAVGALSIMKKIEPGMVIPSSYDVSGLKYEVPAAPLSDFVSASSMNLGEEVESYKVSRPDVASTQTQLVVLKAKKS